MSPPLVRTFGRDIEAPREARALVGRALEDRDAPDLVEDAQLVVSELVANVLHHTPGGGELRVMPLPNGVRVEVDDSTNEPPVVLAEAGSVVPHGRGMQIVSDLSSAWGVEWRRPRGKTVWAELVGTHAATPAHSTTPTAGDARG